jgi:fatty acid desaturase
MPEAKQARRINWYRSPIDREALRALSRRSNLKGFVQTLAYLGLYCLTAGTSLYALGRWPWPVVVLLVFLHGTVAAFMINGVHELGHQTVFRSRWLNGLFMHLLAFLGWSNCEMFNVSHARHHAYTLHPPDDLEVVLPIKLMRQHFFKQGFINPLGPYYAVRDSLRIARGQFRGEWELTLFPPSDPQKRQAPRRWACTLLIGHGLIVAVSLYLHLWLVPVLVTLGPFYGSWLQWLCNNTQHIGLMDNAPDFRLCCRTFIPNPFVRLLYWQMNYHTEHHMYPTVPCYNLGRLHATIRHDLPPCPIGIAAAWHEIAAILRKQEQDPTYQYVAPVPTPASASTGIAF